MANFDATSGIDNFAAGAGADDTFTFTAGTANAGDTFDGNDDTDKFLVAAGETVDFRDAGAAFTSIEQLGLLGGATAIFDSEQLDGAAGALAANFKLFGDDSGIDILQIRVSGATVDLSAMTFDDSWNIQEEFLDQIQIFATAATDSIVGSGRNDTIVLPSLAVFKAISSIDGGHFQDTIRFDRGGKYDFGSGPTVSNVEGITLNKNAAFNLKFSTDIASGDGDGDSVTVSSLVAIKHKVVVTAAGTDNPLVVLAENFRGDDKFTGTDYPKGDTIEYKGLTAGVKIDLGAGTAKGAGIGHDKLISIENAITGSGNDVVVTGMGDHDNHVITGSGDDTVTVGGGFDMADMGTGGGGSSLTVTDNDLLIVKFGAATVGITQGGSQITGGEGSGFRVQFSSVERFNITTGSGSDSLVGKGGNDVLKTGAGDDTLTGGGGRDMLTGGADSDTFLFTDVSEMGNSAKTRDVIVDFQTGDTIDLALIDADGDGGNGDTGFDFLAAKGAAFGGDPELRWFQVNAPGKAHDVTIVEGDIDGDKVGDFQIELKGLIDLTGADFNL